MSMSRESSEAPTLNSSQVIAHPDLLVRCRAPMNGSYKQHGPLLKPAHPMRAIYLRPVLVRTVHWWPASVSVGGLLTTIGTLALEC